MPFINKGNILLILISTLSVILYLLTWKVPIAGSKNDQISQGVLQYSSENTDPVPLAGEWQFQADGFVLDENDFTAYSQVPSTWPGKKRFGYASYRVEIQGLIPGEEYWLKLPYQATAYRLFTDGILLAENGMIGTSRTESQPGFLPQRQSFISQQSKVSLVLQISNYHHRRGGPFQGISLGKKEELERLELSILFSEWAFVILFCTMAISQFIFFFIRKEKPSLYLAMLFISVGINGLLGTSEVLIFRTFPHFPWNLYEKLCYIISYTIPIWPLLFACELYNQIPQKTQLLLLTPLLMILLFVLLTPPWVFSIPNSYFQLYGFVIFGLVLGLFIRASLNRKPGALYFTLATVLIFGIVISSSLFSNDRISSGSYLPLTFLHIFTGKTAEKILPLSKGISYLLIFFINNILGYYHYLNPKNKPQELSIKDQAEHFQLSAREQEVLQEMLSGKSNKEICNRLFISNNTVKTHIRNIYRKTGVNTRATVINLFH